MRWIFRGYKNGFVRHDLSEDDWILPVQGNEYVLNGSELLDRTPSGKDSVEVWFSFYLVLMIKIVSLFGEFGF